MRRKPSLILSSSLPTMSSMTRDWLNINVLWPSWCSSLIRAATNIDLHETWAAATKPTLHRLSSMLQGGQHARPVVDLPTVHKCCQEGRDKTSCRDVERCVPLLLSTSLSLLPTSPPSDQSIQDRSSSGSRQASGSGSDSLELLSYSMSSSSSTMKSSCVTKCLPCASLPPAAMCLIVNHRQAGSFESVRRLSCNPCNTDICSAAEGPKGQYSVGYEKRCGSLLACDGTASSIHAPHQAEHMH